MSRTWSPPSSPDLYDQPVVATNSRGMVTDASKTPPSNVDRQTSSSKKERRSIQYVSRHFASPQAEVTSKSSSRRSKRKRAEDDKENIASGSDDPPLKNKRQKATSSSTTQTLKKEKKSSTAGRRSSRKHKVDDVDTGQDVGLISPPTDRATAVQNNAATMEDEKPKTLMPWQQVLAAPEEKQRQAFQRIFHGLNVDALSSDSDLTDVPSDLASDFEAPVTEKPSTGKKSTRKKPVARDGSTVVAVKEEKVTPKNKSKPKSGLTKSPYFPHAHKPRPTFLSTLPFPPLDLERFGLMQERLCHDPFRLLLATIFLNKTPGQRAMPIFFKMMERYPTPEKLAEAEQADITEIIRELGFQNQRARKCIAMAQRWVQDPPVKGRRWRKPDYPKKGDGKNIKADEIVDDEDERVAWEISHLPGLGPYSHDSWRMFCRDELRGLASKYNGEDAVVVPDGQPFEPEWKRVLPADKELRAWMTWMWMKEGYVWNKETGVRTKASDELMELARGRGNVVLESDASTLVVKSLDEDKPAPQKVSESVKKNVKIDVPAGDYMP